MQIRATWPDTIWSGRAAFLLGKIAAQRGDATAREWGSRAADELPLVGDYALALGAAAARQSGEVEQAVRMYETLATRYPESPLIAGALLASAEMWSTMPDRRADGIARFRALIERFPHDAQVPKVLVGLGDALLAEDRAADAARVFRRVWSEFPAAPEAPMAEDRLEALRLRGAAPATFDERRSRAEALARAGRYREALDLYRNLARLAPSPVVAREMRLQLGATLYRLRRWDEAWAAFRRLGTSAVAPGVRADALLWEGRAAFRREDGRALRRAELALAAAFPDHVHRLELASLRAAWHRGRGDLPAALNGYRAMANLAATLHRIDKIVEAQWHIGWIEYRRGNLDATRAAFETALAAASPADSVVPQLLYWSAKLDDVAGLSAAAAERVSDLVARYPYTYYGYRARRALGSERIDDDQRRADVWSETPRVQHAAQTGDPEWTARYPRPAELLLLGCELEAREELVSTIRRMPPGLDGVPAAVEGLGHLGEDDEALRLVRRHFGPALERGEPPLSASIWKRAYPDRLLKAIRHLAGDLDPFLVAGLIREESVYDPGAVSPVGALGLMQIMPETGQRVARAVGLSDFVAEQLFSPDINLRLGIRYLADLMARFAGNEAYALAAYNAGPDAVTQWIETGRPRSVEEFIEEIPFVETRGYVKRVLRSAWEYRALYGGLAQQARRS